MIVVVAIDCVNAQESRPVLRAAERPGDFELLASRLGRRPLALVVALKRLRQRLRELAGEELADTVCSAEDLAAEQATLLEVLRERKQ